MTLAAPDLRADNVSVRLGGKVILDDVSLSLPAGSMTVLLGPNGAGKTTLIRVLAGVLAPAAGQVRFGAERLADLDRRAAARKCAYLPQQTPVGFDLRVADAVLLGRYPHVGLWRGLGREDFSAVRRAMERVGVAELADRTLPSLSGGERQRVFLARALAQESPLLLLDEPLTALDIGRQLEALELLAELHREGRTVLASMHDLRPAAEFFPQAVLLDAGRIADAGASSDVLSGAALGRAFGIRVSRGEDYRFHRAADTT